MPDDPQGEYDTPEGLATVSIEEIFEADSIERRPEDSIVIVDGEARYDPFAEKVDD